MTSKAILAAAAAVSIFAVSASSVSAKTCKRDYYTGEASGRTWRIGEANAHGVWSNKVRGVLGRRWSYWSNARVRDESCDPIAAALQWCVVEAYPCR